MDRQNIVVNILNNQKYFDERTGKGIIKKSYYYDLISPERCIGGPGGKNILTLYQNLKEDLEKVNGKQLEIILESTDKKISKNEKDPYGIISDEELIELKDLLSKDYKVVIKNELVDGPKSFS